MMNVKNLIAVPIAVRSWIGRRINMTQENFDKLIELGYKELTGRPYVKEVVDVVVAYKDISSRSAIYITDGMKAYAFKQQLYQGGFNLFGLPIQVPKRFIKELSIIPNITIEK